MNNPATLSSDILLKNIEKIITPFDHIAIAVSGGVDSLTLATVCHNILGQKAVMFHSSTPSVPKHATATVKKLAKEKGWALHIIDADEFRDSEYITNPANRCYFCKKNLYGMIADNWDGPIASGTNTDDLSDYRPGLIAAKETQVIHPFVLANISKYDIRILARRLGLGDIAELPAQPCLSSRMETGLKIDQNVLSIIENTENALAEVLGLEIIRCRIRKTGMAIELDASLIELLSEEILASIAIIGKEAASQANIPFLGIEKYNMGSAFKLP